MLSGVSRRIAGAVGGLGLLVALGGTAEAQAPDAERLALATEIAGLIGPAEIEGLMVQMLDAAWPTLNGLLPEAADVALREELHAYFLDEVTPVIVEPMQAILAVMLPEYAAAVAELFTAAEMRAWIDFYATPAGLKLLAGMGQILGQPIIALSLDFDGAMRAGYDALNPVLRRNGLAELTVPDGLPAAAVIQPAISEAAIAARALVPLAPEALDALAEATAADFTASMWELAERNIPAPQAVRDSLRKAFAAGVTAYYLTRTPLIIDQMAAGIAALLTREELDAAIAFYATPEAQPWLAQNEHLGALVEDRLTGILPQMEAVLAPMQTEFTSRLQDIADEFNAILAEHGLPPMGQDRP